MATISRPAFCSPEQAHVDTGIDNSSIYLSINSFFPDKAVFDNGIEVMNNSPMKNNEVVDDHRPTAPIDLSQLWIDDESDSHSITTDEVLMQILYEALAEAESQQAVLDL